MPEIEIQFASPEEYELLRTIRDKYGVLWRGMLIQGATRLGGVHFSRALTPHHERVTGSRTADRGPAEPIFQVTDDAADETKPATTQRRTSVDRDEPIPTVDHDEMSTEDGPMELNLSTSRGHERDLASNYRDIDPASDPGHRWVLE